MNEQLTLDGGAVPHEQVVKQRAALSPAQSAIVAQIAEQGSIRSVEAGTIVHSYRPDSCAIGKRVAAAGTRPMRPRAGCCQYASADGLAAMHRLEDRGLVKRGEATGVWEAA